MMLVRKVTLLRVAITSELHAPTSPTFPEVREIYFLFVSNTRSCPFALIRHVLHRKQKEKNER